MAKKGALTGLLLFGIFFGAGNLIFPPSLGALSGEQFLPAIAGFVLSSEHSILKDTFMRFLRKSHLGLRRFILQSSIYRLAPSLPFHVQPQQLTKLGLVPSYPKQTKV